MSAVIQQTDIAIQPEVDELASRLMQIADPQNQGEDYRVEKNLTLYILGVVIPLLLMWVGWYW